MLILPRQRLALKGHTFGARKDSCTCDPCDCDPCECGDGVQPNYPSWRVSGYFVKSGTFQDQAVAGQILIALSQSEHENSIENWQEIILVDQTSSPAQIQTLLTLFEAELASIPAEFRHSTPHQSRRAVYRAETSYTLTAQNPYLQVNFVPDAASLVRSASTPHRIRPWHYSGPMRLRAPFQRIPN